MNPIDPDYRVFARELMMLCKKHGIQLSAHNAGMVYLGPAREEIKQDFPFSMFSCTPTLVVMGDIGERGAFTLMAGNST